MLKYDAICYTPAIRIWRLFKFVYLFTYNILMYSMFTVTKVQKIKLISVLIISENNVSQHRVLMKIFCTRSRDVTDQCQIMFGMLPVEHHVFLRKVRFLLRFKNSDNLICFLFLDNASSKIKLICKKYSANVNNIYTCIRRAAFGTWLDWIFIMFS